LSPAQVMAKRVFDTGPFGYRPDPPKETGERADFNFKTQLQPKLASVHSGDVDLRKHTTSSSQYRAGSCAGNATADSIEVLNSIEGRPHRELSRMFVYTLARNFMDEDMDGRSDINRDEGTYLRLCFEVLSKFGICEESLWPYELDAFGKPKNLYKLPSLKAMRRATGHKIHSYYRIDERGSDRLDAILAALRANHPVVFGTLVDKDFTRMRDIGPVDHPDESLTVGGHAMIVVGYLTGLGFIVKNSWGERWGEDGFCAMKPSYLAWKRTRDIWVPTRGRSFK